MNRSASRCCRTLQHPIAPCRDAVWITDNLLASAFERYCLVSRARSRKFGHLPGPLECQRRLGRRRMGDAGSLLCPPSPPPWAFPVPLDFSRWTWEPPSLPVSRADDHTQISLDDVLAEGLSALFPRWLRPIARDDEILPATSCSAVEPDASPPTAAAVSHHSPLAADINELRRAASKATDAAFKTHIKDICSKFQQHIFLGTISPDAVLPTALEIFDIIEQRCPSRKATMRQNMYMGVCRAVWAGAANSSVFSLSLVDAQSWNALFARTFLELDVNAKLCELFADFMEAMPGAYRSQLSETILRVLNRFFATWSQWEEEYSPADTTQLLGLDLSPDRGDEISCSWLKQRLRHIQGITRALWTVAPCEPDGLLDAANRLALDQMAGSSRGQRELRYTWLYVLAQLPRVNQKYLFDTIVAFSESPQGIAPLTQTELSLLLITHWRSQNFRYAHLIAPAYKEYCRHRDEAAFSSLFVAIFNKVPDPQRRRNFTSCWRLLHKLRRKHDVVQSLEFDAKDNRLSVRLLEFLALTSRDHNVAIRLRHLWVHRLMAPGGRGFNPSVFEKYAEEIIHDPHLPPKTIWNLLGIRRFEDRRTSLSNKTRHHQSWEGDIKLGMMEKISTAFANAPHLSNRVALRHVSQAYHFYKELGRREVPPVLVENIYRVATKDLMEQRPGRTKRLLWWLSIVERHYGFEYAWKCRVALRQWRATLTRKWISMGFGGRKD
ncbi:hypothetical protein VTK26DRAFT_7257 [Humicola hyalothermophila]